MSAVTPLAPSISAYYEVRHSLTGPGLSDEGMTAFEFMRSVVGGMLLGSGTDWTAISPESDFAPFLGSFTGSESAALTLAAQHMPATYLALLLASSVLG